MSEQRNAYKGQSLRAWLHGRAVVGCRDAADFWFRHPTPERPGPP